MEINSLQYEFYDGTHILKNFDFSIINKQVQKGNGSEIGKSQNPVYSYIHTDGKKFAVKHMKQFNAWVLEQIDNGILCNSPYVARVYGYVQSDQIIESSSHRKPQENQKSMSDEQYTDENFDFEVYIIMDLYERNLMEAVQFYEYSLAQILEISIGITKGLKAMHDNNLTNSDVQPQNFLVKERTQVALCDLGTSLQMKQVGSVEMAKTLKGYTTLYSSPEQIKYEQITSASDIYSLGKVFIVLYNMVHMFQNNLREQKKREEKFWIDCVDFQFENDGGDENPHECAIQMKILIEMMMQYKPEERIQCEAVLDYLIKLQTIVEEQEQTKKISNDEIILKPTHHNPTWINRNSFLVKTVNLDNDVLSNTARNQIEIQNEEIQQNLEEWPSQENVQQKEAQNQYVLAIEDEDDDLIDEVEENKENIDGIRVDGVQEVEKEQGVTTKIGNKDDGGEEHITVKPVPQKFQFKRTETQLQYEKLKQLPKNQSKPTEQKVEKQTFTDNVIFKQEFSRNGSLQIQTPHFFKELKVIQKFEIKGESRLYRKQELLWFDDTHFLVLNKQKSHCVTVFHKHDKFSIDQEIPISTNPKQRASCLGLFLENSFLVGTETGKLAIVNLKTLSVEHEFIIPNQQGLSLITCVLGLPDDMEIVVGVSKEFNPNFYLGNSLINQVNNQKQQQNFKHYIEVYCKEGNRLYQIGTHQDFITDLCIVKRDQIIASSSLDKNVYLWKYKDSILLQQISLGFPVRIIKMLNMNHMIMAYLGNIAIVNIDNLQVLIMPKQIKRNTMIPINSINLVNPEKVILATFSEEKTDDMSLLFWNHLNNQFLVSKDDVQSDAIKNKYLVSQVFCQQTMTIALLSENSLSLLSRYEFNQVTQHRFVKQLHDKQGGCQCSIF